MWSHKTPGIPDELFDRADRVPITKEEVRAVQISKARLCEGGTVYDIGCGSGSITVEAALQVGATGRVFAIDLDGAATELTKRNLAKFAITNADIILADAKDAVGGLPQADSIFIGGTGGETADIVKMCARKLRSGGRIVVGTILVETLNSVLELMGGSKELGFSEVDITQITISKSRKTSVGTMMLARNPVTVVSATKN